MGYNLQTGVQGTSNFLKGGTKGRDGSLLCLEDGTLPLSVEVWRVSATKIFSWLCGALVRLGGRCIDF